MRHSHLLQLARPLHSTRSLVPPPRYTFPSLLVTCPPGPPRPWPRSTVLTSITNTGPGPARLLDINVHLTFVTISPPEEKLS